MNIRQSNWKIIENKSFDITIIGGGINGASIYRELIRQGYKVFLIDKGDFSCGTSQASAMMIWGGLLYLKNLHLRSVFNFSKDRDKIIDSFNSHVSQKNYRYITNSEWGRNKYIIYLALHLYWILGKFKQERPVFQREYEGLDFINPKNSNDSLLFQEGFLRQSDCRFILDWIIDHQTKDCLAMNYCSIQDAIYNIKDRHWSLDLNDHFSNNQCAIKTKMILNCTGVWTDEVNNQFGIQSPYKHVFSKGVFIGYDRPDKHNLPLIFEMGENGDTLTFIPWGPVSLWGPTETMETSIDEGYKIRPEDVHFLLKHANRNLKYPLAESKIISLRCGLRPLVVRKSFEANCYPLEISRNHKIVEDPDLPWITIYGGKISGCISMAKQVSKKVLRKIPTGLKQKACSNKSNRIISWTSFPGLNEKVPSINSCISNEFCCTLEDYLRRRTNISQWSPREGLGFQDENLEFLNKLCSNLPGNSGKNYNSHLHEYRDKVRGRFDNIIDQIY